MSRLDPDGPERRRDLPGAPDLPSGVLDRLRRFGEGDAAIQAIYVFGSRARGSAGPGSDLDVALLIDADERPLDPVFGLHAHYAAILHESVGKPDVDVVLLDSASPLLAHRVISEGALIFCRDEAARVRFHAETLIRYLDTAPLRELERRYTRQRLRDGRFGRAERPPGRWNDARG